MNELTFEEMENLWLARFGDPVHVKELGVILSDAFWSEVFTGLIDGRRLGYIHSTYCLVNPNDS